MTKTHVALFKFKVLKLSFIIIVKLKLMNLDKQKLWQLRKHRKLLSISSDSLLDGRFTQQPCSPQCYKGCPNVVDLYINLAVGEGVFLPKLCDEQAFSARRGMAVIRSSGIVAVAVGPMSAAAGPMSGSNEKLAYAPAQSETENDVAFSPALPPSFEN